MEKLYTIAGATKRLGVSRTTFMRHYRKGAIRSCRRVGRRPLFSERELSEFEGGVRQRRWSGERYYTSAQAARELGISRQLFHYHLRAGHVRPASRTEKGMPLFLEESLSPLRHGVACTSTSLAPTPPEM